MIEFGDLKLVPLETAFGYKKGSLDRIKVEGSVNERKCAAFAQISPLMATLPSNIPPEVRFFFNRNGIMWGGNIILFFKYITVFKI